MARDRDGAGMSPTRVVVVDDQQVVREGLIALLAMSDEIEVVGDAADGQAALDLLSAASELPDVVLMDLRMPVLDGVTATRRITETYPRVVVLVLTTYDDDSSIRQALHAGAQGYLTKDAGRTQILASLRSVMAGQATFSGPVSKRLIAALGSDEVAEPSGSTGIAPGSSGTESGVSMSAGPVAAGSVEPNPGGMTDRELDVLRLIATGLTNREIASTLFVTEATVKTHINNLFAKIMVSNRAEAVRYAYRAGLSS